jgi:hypothetical protein
MSYNPDTGTYTVHDVAGHYIGSTTQPDVAENWWRFASGCKSRGRDATPARCLTAGGRNGVHIIVKRASGFVAGWNFADVIAAEVFAVECNALASADRAEVVSWDDSVWDALLGVR